MIKLHSLKQTCVGAPSQWEGASVDGRPVYIRYRWGELRVHVGPVGGSIDQAIDTQPMFDELVGEKMGAMLDWEEVVQATGIELTPE